MVIPLSPLLPSSAMSPFDSARRDLLRLSSLGLAAALPPVAHAAARQNVGHSPTDLAGLFDIRTYGAVGDGTYLDTNSINRAITAAAAAGGGTRSPSTCKAT